MKKVEPYYLLIAFAVLLLAIGIVAHCTRSLSLLKGGEPIEPPSDGKNGDLFELWFTPAALFDINVDHNVTGIIFGTESKKVSLLDRERKLRWEKSFSTNPLQTQISAGGNHLAVGTEGGDLFFMTIDSQFWWQKELGEPVNLVALSENGKWVLVGKGQPDQAEHELALFSRDGNEQWSISTGPLQQIWLAGEQTGQGKVFYTCWRGEKLVTAAAALTGELLWEIEKSALMALSRTENRLALLEEGGVMVCDAQGDLLWEKELPGAFKPSAVLFNPRNDDLLVYGSDNRVEENLYCFSSEGKLNWHKKIAEGAQLSFTPDGAAIITCSWRQYKEDLSQVVLYDQSGAELSHWELGIRVARLLVSGNRRYIVLAGEDGYIDVVDLEKTPAQGNDTNAQTVPFYSPVCTELKPDQNAITLFFYGDGNLVPVTRMISRTKSPLRAVIEELIRGPSRDSSLCRMIPKEAEVEVVFDSDRGQLFLELLPEATEIVDAVQIPGVLDSLRCTVGCFSEVREIFLNIDQKPVELFEDGHVLKQPLQPYRWEQPLFTPVHIEAHYYLVPREARELGIEEDCDLEGLIRALVKLCRSFYFVPGNLQLKKAAENSEKVTIDLNSSWKMLFPENGGPEDRLHGAMIMDALCLTAIENSCCSQVEILVEGESWSPPQEYRYPLLNRTFYQSYYINPEF